MKHHEDRKRWVKENKVDLLMVGDSITFRWSRGGHKVWDEYYAKRNACNIGSSGDWTKHMLWHFEHGGLDGMKGKNPKLVVLMIGTNNGGTPDEVAYGILAILKELRVRLPESKILLLAIFPRGWEPTNALRIRNNQVNNIIRTYADDKIVHWLDIGGAFLDKNGNLNRELMPDSVHVREKGFRVWAEAMEPTIKRLMGEK
jgi:beta-glucosidase